MSSWRSGLALLGMLLAVSSSGATSADNAVCDSASCNDQDKDQWFDSSHGYLTGTADSAAQWMDSFFGEERSDVESASSRLRVRFEYEWDEKDGYQLDMKLRGKLHLPAGNDRLSLVFEGEDDSEGFDSAAFSTDDDRSVALVLNVWDKFRQRIDLSLGAKAGPKGKLSARYRFEQPFATDYLLRFTEELFWVGGDGLGNLARADVDRVFDQNRLLRWSNRVLYSEESNGVEWSSRLLFRRRLSDRMAVGYFTSVKGETDPQVLTRSYGFGATLRRNFLRRWLFFEVEPSYRWRKEVGDSNREGAAVLLLRLEVALDDRFNKSDQDVKRDRF